MMAAPMRTRRLGAGALTALRARAWRQQGVVVLDPEEIGDPWLRQGLINEATRRYGPCITGGEHERT